MRLSGLRAGVIGEGDAHQSAWAGPRDTVALLTAVWHSSTDSLLMGVAG